MNETGMEGGWRTPAHWKKFKGQDGADVDIDTLETDSDFNWFKVGNLIDMEKLVKLIGWRDLAEFERGTRTNGTRTNCRLLLGKFWTVSGTKVTLKERESL